MRNDWIPGTRAGVLVMCMKWLVYMTAEIRTAWGVPEAEFTALGAFKTLTAKMRFFRDRYFKLDPLTEGDWTALGQAKRYPSLEYTAPGGGVYGGFKLPRRPSRYNAAHLGPPGGATLEEAASDKHYLMRPPVDGKGLTHTFTRWRKEKLIFEAEDAGKTVYVCCRYESQKGEAGQWGPVAQAVIP